jgi:hypothetical protein
MVESRGVDAWLEDNLSEMLQTRRRGHERAVAASLARRVGAGVVALAPRSLPPIPRGRHAPFNPG